MKSKFILVLKIVTVLLLFLSARDYAQYNGNKISIGVNGVYTTTALIYLYPYSSDIILRNTSFSLVDIINPAIDIRYRLTENIIVGFSTEYMRKTAPGYNLTVIAGNRTEDIQVEDGFLLIPFELSAYYSLPFSTDKFKFLMGGGAGYYYGEQIRNFSSISVSNVQRKFAYGIQVSVSADYILYNNISLHSELKFRDPQFIVTSKYNKQQAYYQGTTIRVAQNTFDSKINVNGVTFILGAAFMF
jgi:hypothetical protein